MQWQVNQGEKRRKRKRNGNEHQYMRRGAHHSQPRRPRLRCWKRLELELRTSDYQTPYIAYIISSHVVLIQTARIFYPDWMVGGRTKHTTSRHSRTDRARQEALRDWLVMQTILLGLDLEERALKLIRSHHTCYENCFAISHI